MPGSVDVQGIERAAMAVRAFGAVLKRGLPFAHKAAPLLVKWARENIDRGQSPEGRPFAPLDAAYAAAKQRRYGSQKILVRTRAMYDGINAVVVSPYEARVSSSAVSPDGFPYPAAHQSGVASTAFVALARRQWLGLSTTNRAELARLVGRVTQEQIDAAFRGLR